VRTKAQRHDICEVYGKSKDKFITALRAIVRTHFGDPMWKRRKRLRTHAETSSRLNRAAASVKDMDNALFPEQRMAHAAFFKTAQRE
jgi:hypothetical protein